MIGRFLLGLIKGGLIGAAFGYGAFRAGISTGGIAIGVYGAVGAVVGLVCGRPLWRHDTIWTPILKAVFGFGLGVGVAFAARKWLGGVHLPVSVIPGSAEHAFPGVPTLMGPAVGIVYGVLVEIDDAIGSDSSKSGA